MTTPVEPRPASTVVVLRAAADSYEVLLVRRNDRVAFMAGAFVFPGGRVDPGDQVSELSGAARARPLRFADLSPEAEAAYRRAGARELREEAAVSADLDALIPFAHWVTPSNENRRYDTRFFLTELPSGQQARHDESEVTELAWLHPSKAVDRCRRGDIMLPPPTWTTLRALERHDTLAAALEWARAVPIVRIEPKLIVEGSRRMLTLPGDPTFPAVPGWDVPVETRFVLEEGAGWQPVRP